jgi:hypothetical protein
MLAWHVKLTSQRAWKNGSENTSVDKTSNVSTVKHGLVTSDPIFQKDNNNTCTEISS